MKVSVRVYNTMIFYLSDLHITDTKPINRQDDVKVASLYKLDYVLKTAKERNATVIFGGDIFETPKPSYGMLNAVMEILKLYKVPVYSIIGNHDVIGANLEEETSAIFTLFKSGLVKHLDTLEIGNLFIKGLDYTKEIKDEYFFEETEKKKVLVTHAPLVPEKALFPHVVLSDFKTNANLVLCSHIHKFWSLKVNNTLFLSPGCMTRLKTNEKDNEPLFFVIDETTKPMVKVEKIPLIYKADFVEKTVEDAVSIFGGSLVEDKIEAPKIEQAILSSTYTEEIKNHCIDRISQVRSALNDKQK